MPKVRPLGASFLRGNARNFYIRDNDDLDDIDTNTYRGAAEYPHIHVATTGPLPYDDITYIGITFGGPGGARSIDIFTAANGYLQSWDQTCQDIRAFCPGIDPIRVPDLARYLHNYSIQVLHQ